MEFLHWEFDLNQGDAVRIEVDQQANVLLMDYHNYESYRRGESHRYYGGLQKRSPAHITAPSSGRWHLTIDLAGGSGTIRHKVSLIRRNVA